MPDYEARLLAGADKPSEIIRIECADDAAALEAAQLLVDGHDVELWRGAVKLGTLHHQMPAATAVTRPPANIIPLRFYQKTKVEEHDSPHHQLADDEFAALKQLAKSFARGTIGPEIASRLVALGYAREFMGNLMITDRGQARLVAGDNHSQESK